MTAKALSQLKDLAQLKKLRFILDLEDQVLDFLVLNWSTFSKVMLAMILE